MSNRAFLSKFKAQTIFPYYHLVRDTDVAHIENLYLFKNTKQFLNDIQILKTNYKALNPRDLLNNNVSNNSFLLSFDDGLQEIHSVIYPILKQQGLKAIFFVNPNFIDNNEGLYKHYISIILKQLKDTGFEKNVLDKIGAIFSFTSNSTEEFKKKFINIKFSEREKVNDVLDLLKIDIRDYLKEQKVYISKEQIQEMLDDGFYFGGHTMSHPPLIQLSQEEQTLEIINSIDWLKQNFNINYSLFAFPFSDRAISKKVLEKLFEYDPNVKIFGNSGLKKDMDKRIIQRFSLENPNKETEKQIVTENMYKYFNKVIRKYHIKRK
ncbi:polysaccharide deacetylase family protein [Mariniflexile litorale]|uniref:Polysaccharide deacetylase family protein n=1 Tax=Mariniflexile litorale TaxID=3045158 RepID=A0AAU7ECB2_9FLAO|nr:polysaccharide deacetylase family protein [Mariniflexile sp. KMM 9835]MDQ8213430.1 polysaccharide deacetylase family protein [Mariniflexile sp. KMM 9835]